MVQKKLPIVPSRKEADWITDELRDLSNLKKHCWLRWRASPNNPTLCSEYTRLKLLTSKIAEKTRNHWWEERVEETEKRYEKAMEN